MPVGASPSPRPARSVPFLLAACGFGGTRGHLASVAPFLSSAARFPGTVAAPAISWGSAAAGSWARRRCSGGSVARHVPVLRPSAYLPVSRTRSPGRLAGLMCLGRRVYSISWFDTAAESTPATPTMTGCADDGVGGGGGGAKGEGSPASRETTNPGPNAGPREGAESGGGEAKSVDFPAVTLDEDAVQKFAEIEARWGGDTSSEPTILIRGLRSAEYHVEAAEPTMRRLREAGAEARITGGGRIKHSSERRSVFVYGYSMQFGPANLPRVADLCRKQFGPEYEVTWTEGGY